MVRAATLGAIDFSQFDPFDSWWWKRFHWTLKELAGVQAREVIKVQHNHWVSILGNSRLDNDTWDRARANAGASLGNLLKSYYPWRKDDLGEAGTQTSREQLVAQYHEVYGRPGEERYEQMVKGVTDMWRNPPSQEEKRRRRRRRRMERERREMAQQTG